MVPCLAVFFRSFAEYGFSAYDVFENCHAARSIAWECISHVTARRKNPFIISMKRLLFCSVAFGLTLIAEDHAKKVDMISFAQEVSRIDRLYANDPERRSQEIHQLREAQVQYMKQAPDRFKTALLLEKYKVTSTRTSPHASRKDIVQDVDAWRISRTSAGSETVIVFTLDPVRYSNAPVGVIDVSVFKQSVTDEELAAVFDRMAPKFDHAIRIRRENVGQRAVKLSYSTPNMESAKYSLVVTCLIEGSIEAIAIIEP